MRRLIYLLFAIIIIVIIVWGTGSTQEETEFQPTILNPLGPTVIPVAGITGDKLESDIPVDVHFIKTLMKQLLCYLLIVDNLLFFQLLLPLTFIIVVSILLC